MSGLFERVVAENVVAGMTDESKDAVIHEYLEEYVFTSTFRSSVSDLIKARLRNRVDTVLNESVQDSRIEKCVDGVMKAELDDLGWLKRRIHESFLKRAARKFMDW